MTEPEAEAVVARLTRTYRLRDVRWEISAHEFRGRALDSDGSWLDMDFYYDDEDYPFFLIQDKQRGNWLAINDDGAISGPDPSERGAKLQVKFATQRLPLFRPGCWLSGANIEATAHEKAEWMRGFTQEGNGLWDLKI
jgi:hypothetical protein